MTDVSPLVKVRVWTSKQDLQLAGGATVVTGTMLATTVTVTVEAGGQVLLAGTTGRTGATGVVEMTGATGVVGTPVGTT
jgi:hypothetical protein